MLLPANGLEDPAPGEVIRLLLGAARRQAVSTETRLHATQEGLSVVSTIR